MKCSLGVTCLVRSCSLAASHIKFVSNVFAPHDCMVFWDHCCWLLSKDRWRRLPYTFTFLLFTSTPLSPPDTDYVLSQPGSLTWNRSSVTCSTSHSMQWAARAQLLSACTCSFPQHLHLHNNSRIPVCVQSQTQVHKSSSPICWGRPYYS